MPVVIIVIPLVSEKKLCYASRQIKIMRILQHTVQCILVILLLSPSWTLQVLSGLHNLLSINCAHCGPVLRSAIFLCVITNITYFILHMRSPQLGTALGHRYICNEQSCQWGCWGIVQVENEQWSDWSWIGVAVDQSIKLAIFFRGQLIAISCFMSRIFLLKRNSVIRYTGLSSFLTVLGWLQVVPDIQVNVGHVLPTLFYWIYPEQTEDWEH